MKRDQLLFVSDPRTLLNLSSLRFDFIYMENKQTKRELILENTVRPEGQKKNLRKLYLTLNSGNLQW